MQNDIQQKIHSALLLFLRPIARALLAGGVGYREFSEISKMAFVDVATKDFGLRGRPTNISRVAVMTGLTRKEVRRIRQSSGKLSPQVAVKETPIAHILHRWHTDPEFLTDDGAPLPLSYTGDRQSFASLVKKYGGDVPPGAMRTELERISAIQTGDDGRLSPTKRITYNDALHEKLRGGLANILYPAGLNLVHNLKRSSDSDWWGNLIAQTSYITKTDHGRVKRISNDRIKEFTKSMDDLLAGFEAGYEVEQDGGPSNGRAVGVGIFYFEEDKSDADYF